MNFVLRHAIRRPMVYSNSRPRHRLNTPNATSVNSQSAAYSTRAPTSANFLNSGFPYFVGGALLTAGAFRLVKGFNRSSGEADVAEESRLGEAMKQEGIMKVSSPREVLKAHPVTKNVITQDNLFDKMMEVEMVKEIHCYYDPNQKEFHSVVHLGKEVCGYPNTVHGGLTAAIIDETFGGLMFNIWRSGDLGFSLPAVTSRLEVDYCKRLPQNSVVLCTTRMDGKVQGRSLWMVAQLTDETQTITYATARACFKTPKWTKSALGWIKGITGFQ